MNQQDEILKRIEEARKPAPEAESQDQTEEDAPEVVTDEVTAEAETQPDEVADPEQSDEPVELTDEPSEDEELYVELNGREIPLSQIEEWEQGNLRQKDYTQKTQELAEQRKALEAQASEVQSKTSALDDAITQLEALNNEKEAEINWDELREYDPSEYLKQKELKEQRETALQQAKSQRGELSQEQVQAQAQVELESLIKKNPQWVDNGKETEAYKQDMDRVRTYLNDLGYTEEQQAGILLTGHGQAYIDAAKFHLGQKTNAVVKKKVRKAPVVTKPGGARKSRATSELESAIKAHKRYGTVDTATRLREAQQNAA